MHISEFGLNTETPYHLYSVPVRENTDQNNSEYGLFLLSGSVTVQNIH